MAFSGLSQGTDSSPTLHAIIQRAHAAGNFDGVVVVSRKGKVIYTEAVGLADRAHAVTMRPDTVFRLDYTPYSRLFPRCAMIIHHGGSGTTGLALRSGVPNLIVPFGADQPFWGQRVADLGVGPQPMRFKMLTAERLAQAIDQALTNPEMARIATSLGSTLQAEPGLKNAVDTINSLLR